MGDIINVNMTYKKTKRDISYKKDEDLRDLPSFSERLLLGNANTSQVSTVR